MRKNPFHPPVHSTAAPPSYYFTTTNNGLLMQSADLLAKQKLSVQKIVMTKTVYLGTAFYFSTTTSAWPPAHWKFTLVHL